MRGQYLGARKRYMEAMGDLQKARHAHSLIGSPKTHQAVIDMEAEFIAARDMLWEIEGRFAAVDAARTGERVEA